MSAAHGPNLAHADLREILLALGLGDYARPYSAHEVVQREVLPALYGLKCAACSRREAAE